MKPGRQRHAAAVDRFDRVAVGAVADDGDASVKSSDIGHKRRPAEPVVDLGM